MYYSQCINSSRKNKCYVLYVLYIPSPQTGREHVFLQAEDRLYVSAGADIIHNKPVGLDRPPNEEVNIPTLGFSREQMLAGNKQWIIIPVSEFLFFSLFKM